MNLPPPLLATAFVILTTAIGRAADPPSQPQTREQAETIVATLKPEGGTIPLHHELVTLNVPDTMRFLNSKDASTVLVKLWGNPPQSEAPLGMLIPADCNLLADCWAVIITYEEEGYIKDDDAGKLDYSQLLTQMQKTPAPRTKSDRNKGTRPLSSLAGPHRRATIATATSFIGRKT